MSEHETHPQGSFGIKDGAFVVPEALTRREQLEATAARAQRAHQADLHRPPYDPNARRVEQAEGVGGGIADALDGAPPTDFPEDFRTLHIGVVYDGERIHTERDLELARMKQAAKREADGRHYTSHHGPNPPSPARAEARRVADSFRKPSPINPGPPPSLGHQPDTRRSA